MGRNRKISNNSKDTLEPIDDDWRDLKTALTSKIIYIFNTGLFSDVTLVVNKGKEKKEFKVHEFVLRLSSCVLNTALNSDFKESTTKVIEINDIEHDIFELFLKFLYGENLDIKSIEESIELYKVAHIYMNSPLKDFCIKYIKSHKTSTTACTGFEFASFYMIEDLKSEYLRMLKQETDSVLASANFLNATIETVEIILSEDSLNIQSESYLFNKIVNYIQNRVEIEGEEIKEELVQKLIPKIRYHSMSPKQFTDGPVKSGLLTYDQWPAILANIASPDCSLPFPDGFLKSHRNCNYRNILPNNYYGGW